jgi:NADH-quinone oxidoreductase subunit C
MHNIKEILIEKFGPEIILEELAGLMPILKVSTDQITNICSFLKTDSRCYFDSLSCLTGIDNGPEKNTMEVVYNLYSIPYDQKIALKVEFARNAEGESIPKVSSVSSIWASANWDEREAFDLLGIEFIGHPDLRRILMPTDWEGYPLRKDYQQQEIYHGITVKY